MLLSDLAFLLVLAAIPLQLNKFFFTEYSYVLGIPIDYRAISIYLSDFVIIFYLVSFLFENFQKLGEIFKNRQILTLTILIFNFYLALTNFLLSDQIQFSLWLNLKFLVFSLFAIFASISFSKKLTFKFSLIVIATSLLWQSAVIFLQFALQKSLGFTFLGERTFDSSTVGIAHAQVLGNQILRPYGTFPHPNVAAAFLIISLVILSPLLLQTRITTFKLAIPTISFCAGLLTFSKSAVLALLAILIVLSKRPKQVVIVLLAASILIWVFAKPLITFQIASIAERLILSQAALDIALVDPLFGVGSGNFIPELAKLNLFSLGQIRLLQPAHNVFLLILAENGIFGLLVFSFLLFILIKNTNSKPKIALFITLLVFASFDHFLWTLQQGQLLFWLSVGYILSNQKN